MSKSKILTLGSVCVAGAVAATLGLGGTAFAGGPVSTTYNCQDLTLGTTYTGVTGTLSTTATHKLRFVTSLNMPTAVSANQLITTAKLDSTSGATQFAGQFNDPIAAGSPSTVGLGALPKTSGTITSGTLTTPVGTGATPTVPSATNWSVQINVTAVSGIPNHNIACVLAGSQVSLAY
ncbi:hypothetical protein ACFZBU_29980 [Embleya sp. NPDC008237]|uniref:hypothetical protein n=1 Tax=unclassified Embleya TaxID=2699296 RepID=UPI0036E4ABE2